MRAAEKLTEMRVIARAGIEGVTVEITIGVQNVARELVLESDQTADQVAAAVSAAVEGGTALTLTDTRGGRIIVPTASLGYIEIGSDEPRRVGFGAI